MMLMNWKMTMKMSQEVMNKMASIVPVEKKSLDEKLKILDKIASSTNKKYGKTIMGRIGKDKEIMDKLAIKFIPTPSSSINRDTGGGIPRARFTIITGNPDSGQLVA